MTRWSGVFLSPKFTVGRQHPLGHPLTATTLTQPASWSWKGSRGRNRTRFPPRGFLIPSRTRVERASTAARPRLKSAVEDRLVNCETLVPREKTVTPAASGKRRS